MSMNAEGKRVLIMLAKKHGKVKATKLMDRAIQSDAPGSKNWYDGEEEKNKYTQALLL